MTTRRRGATLGIHHTALIEGVTIRGPIETCSIGPYAVIGYNYENIRAKFYSQKANAVSEFVEFGSGVFVGAHAIVCAGASLGPDTIVEHQCYVGEQSSLGSRCFVRYGAKIFRRVKIGKDCVISGFVCNDTVLKDGVNFFGKSVHRYLDRTVGVAEQAPVIGEGAYVGYDALIVGGVSIGTHAVVKTRAIILSSVPDNHVVEAGDIYRG